MSQILPGTGFMATLHEVHYLPFYDIKKCRIYVFANCWDCVPIKSVQLKMLTYLTTAETSCITCQTGPPCHAGCSPTVFGYAGLCPP